MDCKAKSCATCTRTCWLVHGRKSSSPIVASFFKVMLADDFSKVLYLPPQFASQMWGCVGENAILEDSNGQQWDVKISNVNGSLAFHQGWNKFAAIHDLQLGDFVVFFQLTESLFVVKIYDKTACERVSFVKKCYQRKRTRCNDSSTGKVGPSTSFMPCSDVEVHCMINRSLGEQQGDDRICNLDLSLFEKLNHSSREESGNTGVTMEMSPLQLSKLVASGALHSVKKSCINPTSWHLLPVSVNSKGCNQASQYQKCGSDNDNRQSAQKNFDGVSAIGPTSVGIKNCQSGKRMKVIKEEPTEIISDSRGQETIQMLPASGASNIPSSIGAIDCQSGKIMNVIKAEAVKIKSTPSPCSQKTGQNVCGGSPKLTKSEYFQNVSLCVKRDSRVAQVAKTDRVAQVVKANGVAQVAKTDGVSEVEKTAGVSQVGKTDIVAQVAKTDRAAQMAKTDRAAQVAKADKFAQEMKTDSVVQVLKTEFVDLVGTENRQPVPKIIKEERKPVENTSLSCSWETMGKPCGEPSGVTKGVLPQITVPQVVVKTEITNLDGRSAALSPQSRVPQAVNKTEIIHLDESSPLLATCSEYFVELPEYLPFPIIKGRATVERKTVFLQDPAKRLWPVLYHGKPSLKCLALGWGAFSKANGIKPGDQCCFTLEDEHDGIYVVTVVPR